MLFMLFPKDLAMAYGNVIKKLENVLISGYDIYNLFSAISGDNYRVAHGIDFFADDIEFWRGQEELD